MNIPSWLQISPLSSDTGGVKTATHTATKNTGRLSREFYAAVQGKNGSTAKKNYKVILAGTPAFISGTSISVASTDTHAKIEGFTNCKNFKIVLDENVDWVDPTIVATFLNNPIPRNAFNDFSVPNDPGASEQFAWRVDFDIEQNPTGTDRSYGFSISSTDSTSGSSRYTFTQKSGTPYIIVTPTVVEIPADGGAVEITVESNVGWEIVDADVNGRCWKYTSGDVTYKYYLLKDYNNIQVGDKAYNENGEEIATVSSKGFDSSEYVIFSTMSYPFRRNNTDDKIILI